MRPRASWHPYGANGPPQLTPLLGILFALTAVHWIYIPLYSTVHTVTITYWQCMHALAPPVRVVASSLCWQCTVHLLCSLNHPGSHPLTVIPSIPHLLTVSPDKFVSFLPGSALSSVLLFSIKYFLMFSDFSVVLGCIQCTRSKVQLFSEGSLSICQSYLTKK